MWTNERSICFGPGSPTLHELPKQPLCTYMCGMVHARNAKEKHFHTEGSCDLEICVLPYSSATFERRLGSKVII